MAAGLHMDDSSAIGAIPTWSVSITTWASKDFSCFQLTNCRDTNLLRLQNNLGTKSTKDFSWFQFGDEFSR